MEWTYQHWVKPRLLKYHPLKPLVMRDIILITSIIEKCNKHLLHQWCEPPYRLVSLLNVFIHSASTDVEHKSSEEKLMLVIVSCEIWMVVQWSFLSSFHQLGFISSFFYSFEKYFIFENIWLTKFTTYQPEIWYKTVLYSKNMIFWTIPNDKYPHSEP